jgi:hypothetical protein
MPGDQELRVQTGKGTDPGRAALADPGLAGPADPGLAQRLGPAIARGAAVVASLTILSRVLGLGRPGRYC